MHALLQQTQLLASYFYEITRQDQPPATGFHIASHSVNTGSRGVQQPHQGVLCCTSCLQEARQEAEWSGDSQIEGQSVQHHFFHVEDLLPGIGFVRDVDEILDLWGPDLLVLGSDEHGSDAHLRIPGVLSAGTAHRKQLLIQHRAAGKLSTGERLTNWRFRRETLLHSKNLSMMFVVRKRVSGINCTKREAPGLSRITDTGEQNRVAQQCDKSGEMWSAAHSELVVDLHQPVYEYSPHVVVDVGLGGKQHIPRSGFSAHSERRVGMCVCHALASGGT